MFTDEEFTDKSVDFHLGWLRFFLKTTFDLPWLTVNDNLLI